MFHTQISTYIHSHSLTHSYTHTHTSLGTAYIIIFNKLLYRPLLVSLIASLILCWRLSICKLQLQSQPVLWKKLCVRQLRSAIMVHKQMPSELRQLLNTSTVGMCVASGCLLSTTTASKFCLVWTIFLQI